MWPLDVPINTVMSELRERNPLTHFRYGEKYEERRIKTQIKNIDNKVQ